MDLTKQYPRSPRERLEGVSMYPRTIDKARAQLEGKLGEYIYDCPMDQQLFRTLGVSADQFFEAVRQSPDDAGVISRLQPLRKAVSAEELAAHNRRIDDWESLTDESMQRFKRDLMKIAPGNTRIKNRTDLIDFEEGRLTSVR